MSEEAKETKTQTNAWDQSMAVAGVNQHVWYKKRSCQPGDLQKTAEQYLCLKAAASLKRLKLCTKDNLP